MLHFVMQGNYEGYIPVCFLVVAGFLLLVVIIGRAKGTISLKENVASMGLTDSGAGDFSTVFKGIYRDCEVSVEAIPEKRCIHINIVRTDGEDVLEAPSFDDSRIFDVTVSKSRLSFSLTSDKAENPEIVLKSLIDHAVDYI